MFDYAKADLIGRIGKMETRSVGDHSVLSLSVATSRKKGNEFVTDWHRCEAWNKTAEMIQRYCVAGNKIHVSGQLIVDQYEKNGETKTSVKINIDRFTVIEDKKGEEHSNKNSNSGYKTGNSGYKNDNSADDLPF